MNSKTFSLLVLIITALAGATILLCAGSWSFILTDMGLWLWKLGTGTTVLMVWLWGKE